MRRRPPRTWYAAALRLVRRRPAAERRAGLLAPMAGALAAPVACTRARAALVEALELMPEAPAAIAGSSSWRSRARPSRRSSASPRDARRGWSRRSTRRPGPARRDRARAGRGRDCAIYRGEPRERRPGHWRAAEASAARRPAMLAGEADAARGGTRLVDATTPTPPPAHRSRTARACGPSTTTCSPRACRAVPVGRSPSWRLERYADAAATTSVGSHRSLDPSGSDTRRPARLPGDRALAAARSRRRPAATSSRPRNCARLQRIPCMVQPRALAASVHPLRTSEPRARQPRRAEFGAGRLRSSPRRGCGPASAVRSTINADEDPARCLRRDPAVAGPRARAGVSPVWAGWLRSRWSALPSRSTASTTPTAGPHSRTSTPPACACPPATSAAPTPAPNCSSPPTSHGRRPPWRSTPPPPANAPERCTTPPRHACSPPARSRAAGDSQQAKAALQHVAGDAGGGGAQRLHDTAARELRRLGTRVSAESRRSARGARPERLSPRERHIAELVADGHSNKHIAATLFLSEKTVRNSAHPRLRQTRRPLTHPTHPHPHPR